jgi:hypothetical protein
LPRFPILLAGTALLLAAQVRPGQPSRAPAGQLNIAGSFTPPPDVKVETVQLAPFIEGALFATRAAGVK